MIYSTFIFVVRNDYIPQFYFQGFICFSAVLSKIGSVDVVCNQIVVAMETEFQDEHAQLTSSMEEIQLEVNLIHNQQNTGQRSRFRMFEIELE